METSNKGSFLFTNIEILEYIMSFQQGPSKDKVRAVREVCTCPIAPYYSRIIGADYHTKYCSKCSDEHKTLYEDDSICYFLPQISGCFRRMCSAIDKYLRFFDELMTPAMEELKSRLEYMKSNATYRMLHHTVSYKTIIREVSHINRLYSPNNTGRAEDVFIMFRCYRGRIIRDLCRLFDISHEKYKRILFLQPLG